MVFPEDKLKLIDRMIENFRDESIGFGDDADTLVDCIESVIRYSEETSAE